MRHKKPLLALTFFVCLVFVRNFAFWSAEQTFIFADTAIYALYLAALSENFFSVFSLSDNFFFWNQNYLSIGLPTLSIIDLGYMYPPNVVLAFIARLFSNNLLVFPLLTISAFLHLIFGGYFIFKILKEHWELDEFSSIIGSFFWVGMGFNIEYVTATSVLFAASYLPVCFYLNAEYKKSQNIKHYFLFYILLALSFLVGYPMPAIIIFVVCLAYDVFIALNKINNGKKRLYVKTFLDHLKGFLFITLPLIAPLYFTSILNFPQSVRGSVLSLEGFISNATHPSSLLESILPINTPFSTTSTTHIAYIYFSLVAIIVLLQAKEKTEAYKDVRNITLVVFGIVGVALTLGGITFFPELVYLTTPVISFFRRLAIFSLVPGFALCIIAPQYIKNAFNQTGISKPLKDGIKLIVFLLVLTQALRILFNNKEAPMDYNALLQSLSIVAIVGATAITALLLYKHYPKLAKGLLTLALLIEIGTVVSGRVFLNSKVNPKDVFAPNDLTEYIQKTVSPGERVDMLYTQHNYSVDYLGIEHSAGYVALASEYGVRINAAFTAGMSVYNPKNLRDILGIKYVVKKEEYKTPDLKLVAQISQNEQKTNFYKFNYTNQLWEPEPLDTKFNIYENPTALPRLYLASGVIKVLEQSKTELERIKDLEDARTVVLDISDVKSQEISRNGIVEVLEYKRNYIKASVKADSPTFLANSTGFYPGWWVRINGKWSRPVQTNWFMMGTFLPKGDNIVEFIYIPYGVILGLLYIGGSAFLWKKVLLKQIKQDPK